eukprot:scaffold247867_cov18-Tisochrysis_lutea.AAC.1
MAVQIKHWTTLAACSAQLVAVHNRHRPYSAAYAAHEWWRCTSSTVPSRQHAPHNWWQHTSPDHMY